MAAGFTDGVYLREDGATALRLSQGSSMDEIAFEIYSTDEDTGFRAEGIANVNTGYETNSHGVADVAIHMSEGATWRDSVEIYFIVLGDGNIYVEYFALGDDYIHADGYYLLTEAAAGWVRLNDVPGINVSSLNSYRVDAYIFMGNRGSSGFFNLSLELNGQYGAFQAVVDPTSENAGGTIVILVDEEEIYSKTFDANSPEDTIDIDLKGVELFEIKAVGINLFIVAPRFLILGGGGSGGDYAPISFQSDWPADKTGFIPESFIWSGPETNVNANAYFIAGKYVRDDGLAVLYIDYGAAKDSFAFELYGISTDDEVELEANGTAEIENFNAVYKFEGETWAGLDKRIKFYATDSGVVDIDAFLDDYRAIDGTYYLTRAKYNDLDKNIFGWEDPAEKASKQFPAGEYYNSGTGVYLQINRSESLREFDFHLYGLTPSGAPDFIIDGTAQIRPGYAEVYFEGETWGGFEKHIMFYPDEYGLIYIDAYTDEYEILDGAYNPVDELWNPVGGIIMFSGEYFNSQTGAALHINYDGSSYEFDFELYHGAELIAEGTAEVEITLDSAFIFFPGEAWSGWDKHIMFYLEPGVIYIDAYLDEYELVDGAFFHTDYSSLVGFGDYADGTGFTPAVFNWAGPQSNVHENGRFSAGQYVRDDEAAVLYIDYDSAGSFTFEIYGSLWSFMGDFEQYSTSGSAVIEQNFAVIRYEGQAWNGYDMEIMFHDINPGIVWVDAYTPEFDLLDGVYYLIRAKYGNEPEEFPGVEISGIIPADGPQSLTIPDVDIVSNNMQAGAAHAQPTDFQNRPVYDAQDNRTDELRVPGNSGPQTRARQNIDNASGGREEIPSADAIDTEIIASAFAQEMPSFSGTRASTYDFHRNYWSQLEWAAQRLFGKDFSSLTPGENLRAIRMAEYQRTHPYHMEETPAAFTFIADGGLEIWRLTAETGPTFTNTAVLPDGTEHTANITLWNIDWLFTFNPRLPGVIEFTLDPGAEGGPVFQALTATVNADGSWEAYELTLFLSLGGDGRIRAQGTGVFTNSFTRVTHDYFDLISDQAYR